MYRGKFQMFYKKWDDTAIINHIMSKHGKKPLNSSYYATNYSAVYAAAEWIFGSWENAIEACGFDYSTELPETCSVCGKPLEDGEGGFRKPDVIYCVECYKLNFASCGYGKQESAVIQDD